MKNTLLPKLKRYTNYPEYYSGAQTFTFRGQSYVGVSTILKATEPVGKQVQLATWRSLVGNTEAQRIIDESRARGKRLHRLLDAHLSQRQANCRPQEPEPWEYWDSVYSVLAKITAVHLVEGFVWHPYGFAGVTDTLVDYQGQLCVCDWTTSLKPKHWDWLEPKCLQIAAYTAAINRVYQLQGVRVSHGLLVVALPDAPAQVFLISPAEMMDFWQGFQRRFDAYQLLNQEFQG